MAGTIKNPKRRIKWIVIFFAIAAFWFLVLVGSLGYDDNPDHEGNLYWTDAVFVEDGKIHPENEGKLIAVSAPLETLEPVTDDLIGVTFEAGRVDRHVQKAKETF